MGIQTITTPAGEELVVLSRADYEDLVDGRDHARALAEVAGGRMETLTDAEMDEYLAASTPLAFWRKRRGLTQAALASMVGISQPFLAQIERASRTGDVALYARLARELGVRMEDLVAEDQPAVPPG